MVEAAISLPPEAVGAMSQDTTQETQASKPPEAKQGGRWWSNIFKRHEVAVPTRELEVPQESITRPPTQAEIHARVDAAAEQDNSKYNKLSVGMAFRTVNGDAPLEDDKVLGALEEQRRIDAALRRHQEEIAARKANDTKDLAGVREALAKQSNKR